MTTPDERGNRKGSLARLTLPVTQIESSDSSSPLTMSPALLRGLIPLQWGELLSVKRLRAGLANITRAYVRDGYVDATAAPDFEIDEDRATIDVILKIDEQAPYRLGSIEMLGVNVLTREKLMESLPKSGQVFDGTQLWDFFKANQSILPSDVSVDDVNVKRDPKSKTVAILFDFRTCPQHSN